MPVPRLRALVLVLAIFLPFLDEGWGQEVGKVEGSLTLNGEPVHLSHAAIYAEDEGFYDEDDPTWTLVLTAEPVAPRDLDDPFLDPSLRLGITWTAEFGDEPSLEVLSQNLRVDGASLSGGSHPELEITRRDETSWEGRVFHSEPQEFFDDTFVYDFRFHAPVLDPSAPVGEPLPEGGGEPGDAYLAWAEAVLSRDLDALGRLVPEDMAAMLDEPDAAESLEMMALMTPQGARVVSGFLADGEAVLTVEGTIEGEPVTGEVTMTLQDGFWILTSSSIE